MPVDLDSEAGQKFMRSASVQALAYPGESTSFRFAGCHQAVETGGPLISVRSGSGTFRLGRPSPTASSPLRTAAVAQSLEILVGARYRVGLCAMTMSTTALRFEQAMGDVMAAD